MPVIGSVIGSGRTDLVFQGLDCRSNSSGFYFNGTDHITIENCIVTGPGNLIETSGWGILVFNGDNILISDCTVSGWHLGGIGLLDETINSRVTNCEVYNNVLGIIIRGTIADGGSHHNDIDYNDTYANGSAGIYLSGYANQNLVHNNHSHHNALLPGIYGEPYGIAVSCSSYNEIFENEINDNADHGIEIFSGLPPIFPNSTVSNGNKIYRNRIYNGGSFGIFVNSGGGAAPSYNEIYYNLIYDNKLSGFQSFGPTGQWNKLYNNTIVENTLRGVHFETNDTVWDVRNNIFSDNKGYYQLMTGNVATGVALYHVYNLYWPNGSSGKAIYYNKVFYSLSEVKSTWEPTAIITNPLFVDPINHDFHLLTNSLAIDAGMDVWLTEDFAGNPILGYPDIGAYEYQQ